MPYWAVIIAVVVLVVGYYLLTQQAKERRRDNVGGDFAKIPDFYANQAYVDVKGATALGFDDRRRRLAVARRHTDPRTRVYSFSHIESAELLQDDLVIQTVQKPETLTQPTPAEPSLVATGTPEEEGAGGGSLFGSTSHGARPGLTGLPSLAPVAGQLSRVAVRVAFRNGDDGDQVLVTFYEGKPINVDGVAGEKAFVESQLLMGALAVAIKRAGTPHRVAREPKTPVLQER